MIGDPPPPWPKPVPFRLIPCPDCGGCGIEHCCEGDRAEPLGGGKSVLYHGGDVPDRQT